MGSLGTVAAAGRPWLVCERVGTNLLRARSFHPSLAITSSCTGLSLLLVIVVQHHPLAFLARRKKEPANKLGEKEK